MTTLNQTPGKASGMLSTPDHDRGLIHTTARVEALERPTPGVVRIRARLEESRLSPEWQLPNVAIRLRLGSDYDDASRVYTLRTFAADSATMVFDVVVHGYSSPMMRWVADLQPGSCFALSGPRPHFLIPAVDGRPVALFLDATAIPALYALLSQRPTGLHGVGWVATPDVAAFAELPVIAGLDLQHVNEQGVGAGGVLARRARELPDPGRYVVWGAGERDEMRAIRQHFSAAGLSKSEIAIAGYWTRGVSNTELDEQRRRNYEKIVAAGGSLADEDDLAVGA
ncbi:siderophore-interacting protein [Kerstersia gyiorum]|uniref:siderophore-interacting protein n=1 Tax=Kerstersia gyiorum TaxID=206506 RepID=UPI00209E377B|nr:SIP domain-containing protein [Kerstersia gyiorum]MCP1635186.1 NADPH-dependent ferric siderophore reductase [Kerstersia gyiorum]MCP1669887.1 NADPH-dependent ferric siderophore reductase [Kerstersia gyiorum]MCP1707792.1 NADPH-dependent ferric siderophore reductase [Kerstersia gyiorum]